ncbi:MAG: hypothetical protein QM743_11010 [Chitinophagaceae bacterium]
MMLILSAYNRRIEIPKINRFLLVTCVTLMLVACFPGSANYNCSHPSSDNGVKALFFPALAYAFLQLSRLLVKMLTNTYPITIDRYERPGSFSSRYSRKITYWDALWTFVSLFVFPGLLIYIAFVK